MSKIFGVIGIIMFVVCFPAWFFFLSTVAGIGAFISVVCLFISYRTPEKKPDFKPSGFYPMA